MNLEFDWGEDPGQQRLRVSVKYVFVSVSLFICCPCILNESDGSVLICIVLPTDHTCKTLLWTINFAFTTLCQKVSNAYQNIHPKTPSISIFVFFFSQHFLFVHLCNSLSAVHSDTRTSRWINYSVHGPPLLRQKKHFKYRPMWVGGGVGWVKTVHFERERNIYGAKWCKHVQILKRWNADVHTGT